jgi:hypothetical protein
MLFLNISSLHFSLRLLLLTLMLFLVVSCGGAGGTGNDASADSVGARTPAGEQALALIGKAVGGSLTLLTSDGVRVELAFPAEALSADTQVVIRTVAIEGSQRLGLVFEPAGLLLQNGLQATLTIALPAGQSLPEKGGLVYDGIPIPFAALSDGRLQYRISSFADSSGNNLAKLAQVISNATRNKRSASVLPSSAGNNCGAVPQTGTTQNGVLVVDAAIELDVYGQCMVSAVNEMIANAQYAQAVRTANAIAALLQRAGLQGGGAGTAQNFIDLASSAACLALRDKLEAARQTSVTTTNTLYPIIKPILFWQSVVQKLGAETRCTNLGVTEYQDVVHDKIAQSLAYYQTLRTTVTVTDSNAYRAAAQEVRDGQRTTHEVRSLQVSSGIESTVKTQIEDRAQATLVDNILHAPFKACRDNATYAELILLMQSLNNAASVRRAAQYCGTSLHAQSLDVANSVTASLSPALGGQLSGQNITIQANGSLPMATNGQVRISGPIQALQCPAGTVGGSEALEIRFNGVLLQTLSNAPYLLNHLQFNMSQMLSTAGINANEFSSANLTLLRTGSPCGGFWGDHPQPLLTVQLSAGGCVPAMGQEYCFTVIEIPNANNTTGPMRFSNTGQVLFRQKRAGFVWKAGVLRALPADFAPVDIADDGTVGGDQYENSEDGSISHPSIVKPNAMSSTRLATSVSRTSNPNDFDSFIPNGQFAGLFSFSAAGRATYRVGDEGVSTTDLGYCTEIAPYYYCWNYTYYESLAPNYGTGSPIRTDRLPGSQAAFTIQHDADGLGRVGSVGGMGGIYGMKDFVPGTANAINYATDKTGRVLQETGYGSPSGTMQFNPPSAYLPADWMPIALGINSHAVIFKIGDGATGPQFRLLNLNNGHLTAAMDTIFTIRQAGHDIELRVDGGIFSSRWVDGLGRVLVQASSPTQPDVRAAILTPRGVALP